MGILSSVQIKNPATEQLKVFNALASGLALLQQFQEYPQLISQFVAEVNNAMSLTQPEKDERDAALAAADKAKGDLDFYQQQLSETKQKISDIKTQSDSSIKASKDAADLYVKNANQTITDRRELLDDRTSAIIDRENAAAKREAAAETEEINNKTRSDELDAREIALEKFASALRQFAPNIPVLESSTLEQ